MEALRKRKISNSFIGVTLKTGLVFLNILLVLIISALLIKSLPILKTVNAGSLLFSVNWHPLKNSFGLGGFITGTVLVTILSLVIAVPVSYMTAVYLSEYLKTRIKNIIMPVIDVLAGIPSIIFGLFGILLIVPLVKNLGRSLGIQTNGYCWLSASIILSIMVVPILVSLITEVLSNIPLEARETSISLGSTKWEMVSRVLARTGKKGISGAILLAFSRAIGETMAVMMVAGNVNKIPENVFSPVYTLPSLIANNYGEVMSVPQYESALMLCAFILLLIVAVINITARVFLYSGKKGVPSA